MNQNIPFSTIRNGFIISNAHFVKDCSRNEIIALSSLDQKSTFLKIVVDSAGDLAILLPTEPLKRRLGIVALWKSQDLRPNVSN